MKRPSVLFLVAAFKRSKNLQSEQVWIGWFLRPAVNTVPFLSWWTYQPIQYKSALSDFTANWKYSCASCMRCHEASGRPPIFYQQLRHLWLLHPPEPLYFQTQGSLKHSRMQWDAVRLVLPCWFVKPRLAAVNVFFFPTRKVRALWGPFATEGGGFWILPAVVKY